MVWKGGVVLYLCELGVWILCVEGRFRFLCIVLGGYMRILGAPSIKPCCNLSISASYRVFSCGRYRISRHVCVLSDLDLSRHPPFYEKQCQPPSGSA